MFSVIFPGQGSQSVGMAREFYDKFEKFKKIFNDADNILDFPISKLILDGPKQELNLTENTQPAIFLVGYSIFKIINEEFNIDLNKASFFAGHSLGEYTALSCSGAIDFESALKLLKIRGRAMQNSVPKGAGGMIAILGTSIENIEKILINNSHKYTCHIANDNSTNQIVISGYNLDLDNFEKDLKILKIKNIRLQVSAPFHCNLMNKATILMTDEINKLKIIQPKNPIVTNVTGKATNDISQIRNLMIKQIEKRVRWRESINFMISQNINNFIEIGPGKVLINLIKRSYKDAKVCAINNISDIQNIEIND